MIITRAAARSMNPVFAWLIIDQSSVTVAEAARRVVCVPRRVNQITRARTIPA
jgi:hypothetical protein